MKFYSASCSACDLTAASLIGSEQFGDESLRFMHKCLRAESLRLMRQVIRNADFSVGFSRTARIFSTASLVSENNSSGMPENFRLTAVAVGKHDCPSLDHFRYRDAEALRTAGLNTKPAMGKNFSLAFAGYLSFQNDPVRALTAKLRDLSPVGIVLNLSAEVEPNSMAAFSDGLKDGDCLLDLLLGCNTADHCKRLLLFRPWNIRKHGPDGWIDDCRAVHIAKLFHRGRGPVGIGN